MPGLTGLWQISGRSSIPNFDDWIELDLEYARNWSIGLDLRILVRTVSVVILARGAQ
jgi:lipopolysaccharide/colanic/teichoic acid biosynthesis glycosyltransferase